MAGSLLAAIALLAYVSLYDRDPKILSFNARDGRLIGTVDAAHQGIRYWTPLKDIPPTIVDRTIRSEDRWFYWHRGINPFAALKAALENFRSGCIVRGGSTITQQLAKNLIQEREGRLSPRNVINKAREALLAAGLEMRHGKRWIIERYLNTVYYGRRAYGVAAAADLFFSKDLSALTDGEIAAIVQMPKAPGRAGSRLINPLPFVRGGIGWGRSTSPGPSPPAGRRAGLQRRGKGEVDRDLPPPTPPYKGGERVGRHFIEYAAELYRAERGHRPDAARLATTLDLDLQKGVEDAVRAQLAGRAIDDPKLTAAVVVIDVASGDLLAVAGSRDYFDDAIDGQVNGATALRQPGSALKPFTYFAAFTKGFSPNSIVPDEPLSFQAPGADDVESYAPQNFDRRYHGEMTMRAALANSYNVPAIVTLNEIGLSYYHGILRKFGITSLNKPPPHYGLSVTLGSGEVTLLELTNAYAALARGGAYLPVRIWQDQRAAAAPIPVVPGAARFAAEVTSILSDPMSRRKAFGFNESMEVEGHPVAIKTGTSFEHRDNWAVGYAPSFAVGVWVGHADGSPMDPQKASTGATGAAPIWHAVMELILRGTQPLDFPRLREASAAESAPVVSRRDAEMPSLMPQQKSFRITAPVVNTVYRFHGYLPAEHQMIKAEVQSPKKTELNWYLDGEFIKTTTDAKASAWIDPIIGRHRLRIETTDGERQEVVYKVIDSES